MEFLYNPDRLTEEELRRTFVARQPIVDELLSLVEKQPDGAGVQHVVLIGPRGMGKTTLLLMTALALRERCLAHRWQAVRFREESPGIYDLADLWLEAVRRLAEETGDPGLAERGEEMKRRFRGNDELQEAAFALLKDWRREHEKRLLLLVDNFDEILEQIHDEQDNARLRSALTTDETLMLVATATTFFREARASDQPLYNFFKIIGLEALDHEQMLELLRSRVPAEGKSIFEEGLVAKRSRLRALEHFTGGNPRLVLMLYEMAACSDALEVRQGLEKLLDEVTPFYKARLESLPPQQRKILDQIARAHTESNRGQSPTEIARETRLSTSQVSAQLGRLAEQGYVRPANVRGRGSCYTLSEPLYSVWHQMRLGRAGRERLEWFTGFLRAWYDAREAMREGARLEALFHSLLREGALDRARDALEHWRHLRAAPGDPLSLEIADSTRPFEKALEALHLRQHNEARMLLEAHILTILAIYGREDLVRQIIADSGLEQRLLPLVVALDIRSGGDRETMEKLPPEMRSVVEQILKDLEEPAAEAEGDEGGRSLSTMA